MTSIDEIRKNRLDKLEILKKNNMDPYPVSVKRDCDIIFAQKNFKKLSKKKVITLVGRIMAMRPQGKLVFLDLNDGTGKFQTLMQKDEVGGESFGLFSKTADIGDFIEVSGSLFITKKNEKTLNAKAWNMLCKSLRPLPEKWHGLQDVEERFRKRYLDLIASPEVKNRFLIRSKIVSEIRQILNKNGFVEVETSMLQPLVGGANALPFKTHHNALEIDIYLRIAQELDLKKLLIGGFPKVYELGRNFRNEGIDAVHNPEFTTVEWYEAFSDAAKQREFVEEVYKTICKNVTGKNSIEFNGALIDLSKKFAIVSYFDLLKRFALISNPENISKEELLVKAAQLGMKVEKTDSMEKIFDGIYKKTCRPKLIQPTFIVDYPSNALPLAKKKADGSGLVDAFQLVAGGMELVKAFSELNDPIDQSERFAAQEKDREAGDTEAQRKDADFLEAMEHGMPPAGGVGLSIDRASMLFTNAKNIREVIFFPTLRPKS